jgi:hypothetical protein
MALTDEQLREVLGLVDGMLRCEALVDSAADEKWRAHLESSITTCAEKIRSYVDLSCGVGT